VFFILIRIIYRHIYFSKNTPNFVSFSFYKNFKKRERKKKKRKDFKKFTLWRPVMFNTYSGRIEVEVFFLDDCLILMSFLAPHLEFL